MPNNSPYAELSAWPNLSPALKVEKFNAELTVRDALTIHRDKFAMAGLSLSPGVFIARFKDRVLFSLSKFCEGYRMGTKSERFPICKDGLNANFVEGKFTLLYGQGYLVMTTHEDAASMLAPVSDKPPVFSESTTTAATPAETLKKTPVTGYPEVPFGFTKRLTQAVKVIPGVQVRPSGVVALSAEHLEAANLHSTAGFNIALHQGSILLYSGFSSVRGVFSLRASARQFLVDTDGADLGEHPVLVQGDGYIYIANEGTVSNLAPHIKFKPLSKVNNMATAAQSTVQNNATYSLTGGQSRIQVQGKWLRALGFVPGEHYRFEKAANGKQLIAVLDKNGPHQVTTMSGTTPKLYVPRDYLRHLTAARVNIVGGNLNSAANAAKFGVLSIVNDGPLPVQAKTGNVAKAKITLKPKAPVAAPTPVAKAKAAVAKVVAKVASAAPKKVSAAPKAPAPFPAAKILSAPAKAPVVAAKKAATKPVVKTPAKPVPAKTPAIAQVAVPAPLAKRKAAPATKVAAVPSKPAQAVKAKAVPAVAPISAKPTKAVRAASPVRKLGASKVPATKVGAKVSKKK